MDFLLDTNAVIDLFRGLGNVAANLAVRPPSAIAVSSVTIFELERGIALSGGSAKRRHQLGAFLSRCTILHFDTAAASAAARIAVELQRAGRQIGPFDTLIAGVAPSNAATLAAHNTGEFARVPGPPVEDWH